MCYSGIAVFDVGRSGLPSVFFSKKIPLSLSPLCSALLCSSLCVWRVVCGDRGERGAWGGPLCVSIFHCSLATFRTDKLRLKTVAFRCPSTGTSFVRHTGISSHMRPLDSAFLHLVKTVSTSPTTVPQWTELQCIQDTEL